MGMVVNQYNVYLVNLDPTIGHEIKKTRPCLVISPDEMNHNIDTVIIAPMTTKSHAYPTRAKVEFDDKRINIDDEYISFQTLNEFSTFEIDEG